MSEPTATPKSGPGEWVKMEPLNPESLSLRLQELLARAVQITDSPGLLMGLVSGTYISAKPSDVKKLLFDAGELVGNVRSLEEQNQILRELRVANEDLVRVCGEAAEKHDAEIEQLASKLQMAEAARSHVDDLFHKASCERELALKINRHFDTAFDQVSRERDVAIVERHKSEEEYKAKIDVLEKYCAEAKKSRDELRVALKVCEEKVAPYRATLEQQCEMQKKLHWQEREICKLRAEVSEAESKVERTESARRAAENPTTAAEFDLIQVRRSRDDLQETVRKLQFTAADEYSKSVETGKKHKAEIDELKGELEVVRNDRRDLQAELRSIKEMLQDRSDVADSLAARLDDARAEAEEARVREVEGIAVVREALEKALSECREENEFMKKTILNDRVTHHEELESRKAVDLDQTRRALGGAVDEARNQSRKLALVVDEKNNEIAKLRADHNARVREIREINVTLRDSMAANDSLQQRVMFDRALHEKQMEELAAKKTECEKCDRYAKMAATQKRTIAQQDAAIKELKEKIGRLVVDVSEKMRTVKEQTSDIELLKSATKTEEEFAETNEANCRTIEQLERYIDGYKKSTEQLTEEVYKQQALVTKHKEELDRVRGPVAKEVERYANLLVERNGRIADLEALARKLRSDVQSAHDRYEVLQNTCRNGKEVHDVNTLRKQLEKSQHRLAERDSTIRKMQVIIDGLQQGDTTTKHDDWQSGKI